MADTDDYDDQEDRDEEDQQLEPGPTRNLEFDIDPLQKLPIDNFLQEISKRCGDQSATAYEIVKANKELCYNEDENERANAIYELLKDENIQVDDFDYFISHIPSYIIMNNMKL